MKADTARSSFDPAKHYRSVLRQQGRVDLESDTNEQAAIIDHLRTATTADVIGPAGTVVDEGGFGLFTSTGEGPPIQGGPPYLAAGNYYLDGLLLENERDLSVWDQPDLPAGIPRVILDDGTVVADGATPPAGRYTAFIHAFDLHRTALEDYGIREVALGGPDTTTRVKTAWQVRLLRLGDLGAPSLEGSDTGFNCLTPTSQWRKIIKPSTGTIEARSEPDPAASGPCVVPAAAGYRGLENQHYRVEIHKGGTDGVATWKWARDNASRAVMWVDGPDPQGVIRVLAPGRDAVTGFAPGMWVELIDDTRELDGRPGTLVQLVDVVGRNLTLANPAGIDSADYLNNPRVRRWDSAGELPAKRPAANGGWVGLEDGVQIRLAKQTVTHNGGGPVTYRTGDYWTIPARSVLGDVLWPLDQGNNPLALPPAGIGHHYGRLGLISFDGERWGHVHDCRPQFPPLTRLKEMRAVSGDGQTMTPGYGAPFPVALPDAIVVGVTNGEFPVEDAGVYFKVEEGGGLIDGDGMVFARTDQDGLASVTWSVDHTTPVQRISARLLDDDNNFVGVPVEFTASLLTADRVAYSPGACTVLQDATNVQQALDTLCRRLPTSGIDGILGTGIDGLVLPKSGAPLGNDVSVTVGELAAGIVIEAADSWEPSTFGPASAGVTIEVPWPITDMDRESWQLDGLAAFQPMVLAGTYETKDRIARWGPQERTVTYLSKLLELLRERNLDPRVLARLTLRGELMLNKDRTRYVDAGLFVSKKKGFGPDLPTGKGPGQTGEVWFWIVPLVSSGVGHGSEWEMRLGDGGGRRDRARHRAVARGARGLRGGRGRGFLRALRLVLGAGGLGGDRGRGRAVGRRRPPDGRGRRFLDRAIGHRGGQRRDHSPGDDRGDQSGGLGGGHGGRWAGDVPDLQVRHRGHGRARRRGDRLPVLDLGSGGAGPAGRLRAGEVPRFWVDEAPGRGVGGARDPRERGGAGDDQDGSGGEGSGRARGQGVFGGDGKGASTGEVRGAAGGGGGDRLPGFAGGLVHYRGGSAGGRWVLGEVGAGCPTPLVLLRRGTSAGAGGWLRRSGRASPGGRHRGSSSRRWVPGSPRCR